MEIHQLRYVVAVVDEGSFTKAAERVHVSQSGVSAQIRQLERELGQPLLDRSDRRVRTTDAGAAMLPFARAALGSVDAIREAVDDVAGLVRGAVRVGMVTGCSIPWFLDALAAIRTEHPGLAVTLTEGPSADLQRQVLAGDLGLALVGYADRPLPGLDVQVVVDEPIVAVVHRQHPLASRRSVRLRDLDGHTVITLADGTGIRAAFDGLCRKERSEGGVERGVDLEASSPETVLGLVCRNLGVAILSASMVRGADDLVALDLAGGRVSSRLGLVWKSAAPIPAATAAAFAIFTRFVVPATAPRP